MPQENKKNTKIDFAQKYIGLNDVIVKFDEFNQRLSNPSLNQPDRDEDRGKLAKIFNLLEKPLKSTFTFAYKSQAGEQPYNNGEGLKFDLGRLAKATEQFQRKFDGKMVSKETAKVVNSLTQDTKEQLTSLARNLDNSTPMNYQDVREVIKAATNKYEQLAVTVQKDIHGLNKPQATLTRVASAPLPITRLRSAEPAPKPVGSMSSPDLKSRLHSKADVGTHDKSLVSRSSSAPLINPKTLIQKPNSSMSSPILKDNKPINKNHLGAGQPLAYQRFSPEALKNLGEQLNKSGIEPNPKQHMSTKTPSHPGPTPKSKSLISKKKSPSGTSRGSG